MENLFRLGSLQGDEEVIQTLVQQTGVEIQRIVSTGQASPKGFWYDQSRDEWVVLLTGSARLLVKEGDRIVEHQMRPGDYLWIPAHQPHRVQETAKDQATIWLAVFLPDSTTLPSESSSDTP